VELTPRERAAVAQQRGAELYDRLARVITSPYYQRLTDAQRIRRLEQAIGRQRRRTDLRLRQAIRQGRPLEIVP
jgi:uncharacterized protein YbjT (DUF2867 family)